ncbi:hypothetical protein NDU88_000959 [Pleurodeles waltl]|uniref:Uncharacterized protein n=1 Tax=Pleurodeles waltl TaxID=8319 RepID=A0AAV7M3X1_PLEWA|nr:hypothetical protein NDU88_000959 [Pleurodeles waltl]
MTSLTHLGPRDSQFPLHSHKPPQSLPPQKTQAHTSVPRTRQAAVCPPLQGTQANLQPKNSKYLGAVAVGTRFRGQRHRKTGELGGLLCDKGRTGPGTYSPQGPLQHHGSVPSFPGENGNGTGQVSGDPAAAGVTLFGVQGGTQVHQHHPSHHCTGAEGPCEHQEGQLGAPDTSLDDELPTTSACASVQEALPQDHDTSTPPAADGEPPRKWSLRSRTKTENNAKTPAKK